MSSAGTNGTDGSDGTDLSTTLTTQGDLLYRDGSGLQRLAKGTANQTLQMNSGANAPTWTTAEGGTHVKIATLDHGGSGTNAANVTFSNCFTSTYDIYKVYFANIASNSNNYELAIGLLNASNTQISNNYSAGSYGYIPTGSGSGGGADFSQTSDSRIRMLANNIDNVETEPSNVELTIYNPYASSHTTTWYNYSCRSSNNHYYNVAGASVNRNTTSVRSLKFYQNGGGEFSQYKATIYGVKR
jgi:hypothetical protein